MREAARKRGVQVDEEAAAARLDMFKSQVEEQSDAFYISSRCIDDGVIDPRDTRNIIGARASARGGALTRGNRAGMCLSVCHSAEVRGTMAWGVHRM